ncbi:MAG: zinc ribbon domain-containing protein [Methanomassiliicoccales archaeon]|nr:zinc ribbon domain-containing protein [Methanomassiliicoccales archaeon]
MSAICVLALFLTFLPLIDSVSAAEGFKVNGDVLIKPGYYCKLPFVMATDGVLEFTVTVHSGPNIDVILISASELSDYENGDSYTYYLGGTFSDCDEAEGDVYLNAGTYYLILSNDGSQSASVHYMYTPTAFSTGSDDDGGYELLSSTAIVVMIAVIAIVVILALAYASEMKKKENILEIGPVNKSTDAVFCRHCGEPILDDSVYCGKCGGRIR